MVYLRAAIIFLIVTPLNANATIIFSEIAWMGDEESANNEWIEIYNFDSTPTNIDGWTIRDEGTLEIPLSGTMPPHSVFLLERSDDDTVPGISASVIYTGALTNEGATLTIRDETGAVVGEPLVGGEDWVNIGGNNEYKYTAQLSMLGEWITGTPTPGMQNIEEDTEVPEEDNNNDTQERASDSSSQGGNNASISLTLPDTELVLELLAPSTGYVNQPIAFDVDASGIGDSLINSLKYEWNFGDMHTSLGKEVSHTFSYPGTYVVVVEAEYARHSAHERHEITILPQNISIGRSSEGDIHIHNDAPYEIDIGGFTLHADTELAVPKNTILLPNGSLTIPRIMVEEGNQKIVMLNDVSDALVASHIPDHLKSSVRETVAMVHKTETNNIIASEEMTKQNEITFSEQPSPLLPEEIALEEATPGFAEASAIEAVDHNSLEDELPYLALMGVMMLGVLAIYTRKMI